MNKKIIKPGDFIIGYEDNSYCPYLFGKVKQNSAKELLVYSIGKRKDEINEEQYIGNGGIGDLIYSDVSWLIFPSEEEKTEFLALDVVGKRRWIEKRRHPKGIRRWRVKQIGDYFVFGCGKVILTTSEIEEVRNLLQAIVDIPTSKRLKEVMREITEQETFDYPDLPDWIKRIDGLSKK